MSFTVKRLRTMCLGAKSAILGCLVVTAATSIICHKAAGRIPHPPVLN